MEGLKQTLLILTLVCVGVACSSNRSNLDNPISQGTEKNPGDTPPDDGKYGDWLKKRIVVFPFINRSKFVKENLGVYAGKLLTDMMMRTHDYVMVNFEDLNISNDEWMIENDFVRPRILELTRGSGVNGFVIGTIEKVIDKELGDDVGLVKQKSWMMEVQIRFDFIDSRSGRVLATKEATGKVEETGMELFMFEEDKTPDKQLVFEASKLKRALYKAFLEIVPLIEKNAKKVDWSGRIARLEGERIYINAGQVTGIRLGDVLKILEESDDVLDPVDGALIGQSPGRVKGTLKVTHFFGKDGAIGNILSGGQFKEGDRVELY